MRDVKKRGVVNVIVLHHQRGLPLNCIVGTAFEIVWRSDKDGPGCWKRNQRYLGSLPRISFRNFTEAGSGTSSFSLLFQNMMAPRQSGIHVNIIGNPRTQ
jgi:hypothetical protein